MSAATRRAFAVAAMLLALLGIFAAVQRASDVLERPAPGALSVAARGQMAQTAELMRIPPGTPDHRELERQTARTLAKYHEHPFATMVHMIAGSLVLSLAFAQFSARARSRWPRLHRWTGRFLLAMIGAAGISGMFFAVGAPIGGWLETAAGIVFGGFFVFAAAKGWIAIRAGRRAEHREWMIRMFATAIAIAVMRLGLLSVIAMTDVGLRAFDPDVFAATLWIGWVATLAVAELYIRSIPGRGAPRAAGSPRGFAG